MVDIPLTDSCYKSTTTLMNPSSLIWVLLSTHVLLPSIIILPSCICLVILCTVCGFGATSRKDIVAITLVYLQMDDDHILSEPAYATFCWSSSSMENMTRSHRMKKAQAYARSITNILKKILGQCNDHNNNI